MEDKSFMLACKCNISENMISMEMEPYQLEDEVLQAGQEALTTGKPTEVLMTYLEKYQQNLLVTGTAEAFPSFQAQRGLLINAMRKKYADGYGFHQTLNKAEVNVAKFWELLLSLDFVSNEIKLVNNIGYDDRPIAAGIYRAYKLPYAEFVVMSGELQKLIAPTEKSHPQPDAVSVSLAEVFLRGNTVYARYENKQYAIQNLREGGTYHKLMEFLLAPTNLDIDITIDEVQAIEGLASIKSFSEPLRHCGFNEALKKVFFPTRKKDRIRFSPNVILTPEQLDALKRQSEKFASRSRV